MTRTIERGKGHEASRAAERRREEEKKAAARGRRGGGKRNVKGPCLATEEDAVVRYKLEPIISTVFDGLVLIFAVRTVKPTIGPCFDRIDSSSQF